jgi:threonine dehydrogenase-like Zn-dependent dehydrogenase
MRAVVLKGPRSVATETVPDATLPGATGAVVAIEATGICGSDLHLYHGHLGGEGTRLGHEGIGRVLEVGSEVRTLREGDRVLVSGVVGCGHCLACRAGDPVVCTNHGLAVFGTGPQLHGAQAEALAVPAADLFTLKIPEEVSVEAAVLLTDILPTGYLGALRADISPGDTVAVIGLGPVGVLALQCAQLFGPARVLALDVVPDRLARAATLGAEPIDASDGLGVAKVVEATGGWGADAVIEAVGADQTINDAIMCAAPGATVSVVGANVNMALPIPMAIALFRRLTLRVTLASIPSTWPALLPLLASGRLAPDGVFTHRIALSEADDAYRIFDNHEDGVLKVLLDPTR